MAVQQVAEAERIRREEEERLRAEQAAFEAAAAVPLSSIGKLLGQQATAPPKRRPKVIPRARPPCAAARGALSRMAPVQVSPALLRARGRALGLSSPSAASHFASLVA